MTKGQKRALWITAIIFVLCLIPIPIRRKDGGTVEYCALLYRYVDWKILNSPDEAEGPSGTDATYLTGHRFDLFPFNFQEAVYDDGQADS